MTQSDYVVYLKSREWQDFRRLVFRMFGGRCALNARHTQNLEIHHRTYERLGRERLEDVILICRECHELYQGMGMTPEKGIFAWED